MEKQALIILNFMCKREFLKQIQISRDEIFEFRNKSNEEKIEIIKKRNRHMQWVENQKRRRQKKIHIGNISKEK